VAEVAVFGVALYLVPMQSNSVRYSGRATQDGVSYPLRASCKSRHLEYRTHNSFGDFQC
jgi:hypothetical protein